jgi:hypothetical protein
MIYTLNGILFRLKKEILQYMTTQMIPEGDILCEKSQSQNKLPGSTYMRYRKSHTHRTGIEWWLPGDGSAGGEGNGELLVSGYEVSVMQNE